MTYAGPTRLDEGLRPLPARTYTRAARPEYVMYLTDRRLITLARLINCITILVVPRLLAVY